ncbi:MAG: NADH:flavin oxidoreductase/NADH oxidase [Actinobacteria bacterium]|nr:NADH:flavin oxidoreductase/NADH oxidase [Actinomycetota bacterium]
MPSALFTPLTLRGVTLPNRAWVSPMCMYSAVDGLANEWHRVHYGALATGGAGLLMVESAAVLAEGRISGGDLGLWNDRQSEALRPIVEFAHAQGMKIGIQIAHAGRKASTFAPGTGEGSVPLSDGGWQTVAPVASHYGAERVPKALDEQGIAAVVQATAEAAARAADAGFDVLEIQCGHGYLLHEFCSPLTNLRTDGYGGSFDGRTRIVRETVEAVRQVWPAHLPLFVRISATDWVDGGWTIADTVALAQSLRDLGIDLVDCTSGGLEPGELPDPYPAYEVDFAASVRNATGLASTAVGFITEASQAELLIASGQADAVMLGRVMLRQPRWPLAAAGELGDEVPWPLPYDRARPERSVPRTRPFR